MSNPVNNQHAGYSSNAFWPEQLVELAKARLAPYADQFDVLVGTGLSGALVVSLLGYALGKRFIVVRKPDDTSNHSGRRWEGVVAEGDRLLFVDDFVSSGRTIRRALETLRDNGATRWRFRYVGRFEYQGEGMLTWENSERWGVSFAHEAKMPAPSFIDEAADLMARQMATPPRYKGSTVEQMQRDYVERNYPKRRMPLPTYDFETFKKQEAESIKQFLAIDWCEVEKRVVASGAGAELYGNNSKEFFHD